MSAQIIDGRAYAADLRSGLGRELGPDAVLAYTELKNVSVSTTA